MGHIEKLKEDLTNAGWHFSTQPFDTGVDWYAHRRVRSAVDCASVKDAPRIMIQPYDRSGTPVVEVTVSGKLPSGSWVTMSESGIKAKEVMDVLDAIEHTLSAAWNACASLAQGRSN